MTVTQSDDRFNPDTRTTIGSRGNRISKKSIAGGTHIDDQGVSLNPWVTKDRTNGHVELITLHLVNEIDRDSTIGSSNLFGRPERVSFLTGEGAPIVLDLQKTGVERSEADCSKVTLSCEATVFETGIAIVSLDQYRRLMTATALAIKVDGQDRSHVFEMRDIAPTFIPTSSNSMTSTLRASHDPD